MSEPVTMVMNRHFDAADRDADPYPLIPFDVPPGTGCVAVSYQVSDAISADQFETRPGNVVDLGVLSPDGFRGWSGSARTAFTLAAGHATPGYLAGPITPGRWHVLLGLYRMGLRGCDVRVEVTLSGERGWYRGDLHCHSHHSEATGSVADLLAAARAQGLDFLAVTEHNTISHLAEIAGPAAASGGPVIVPGMEVTTYRGHANVLGSGRWYDFRCRTPAEMAVLRAQAQTDGALFVINHPKTMGPPWELGDEGLADAVEVWGGPWAAFNYQSLGLWDRLLKEGRRITAVGGSDKHQEPFDGKLGYHEVGRPTTWVHADTLSAAGIVAGLRAGRAFISEGPAGPHLELMAETDGQAAEMGAAIAVPAGGEATVRCRVMGAAGRLLRRVSAARAEWTGIEGDDWTYEWQAAAGDGYWRIEVMDAPPAHQRDEPAAHPVVALSNPIYVEPQR